MANKRPTVSKVNRFPKPDSDTPPPLPGTNAKPAINANKEHGIMPAADTALSVLSNELSTARARVESLEKQLADEQAGRRADLERLLREQADLRARIATLEADAKRDGGSTG